MKKIGICSDHAGFEMKEYIKSLLNQRGFEIVDFGTHSTESCDYPDFAHLLGKEIESGALQQGISVCGSGNGISMVMNKYPKVRAALCWSKEIAELARAHNNANVLSVPARFVSQQECSDILNAFIDTPFEGGRHQNRIDKIPINIVFR